jgi:hypothetical protein
VLFTPVQLVYEYIPRNPIPTYVVVGVVSLISVMCEFAVLDENGITHSLKFSVILDTTRSPDLALMLSGCGLGVEALRKTARATKLTFGYWAT